MRGKRGGQRTHRRRKKKTKSVFKRQNRNYIKSKKKKRSFRRNAGRVWRNKTAVQSLLINTYAPKLQIQESQFVSPLLLSPPSYEIATKNQQVDSLANSRFKPVLHPQKSMSPQVDTPSRALPPVVWDKDPVPAHCFNCKQNITTHPTAKIGLITYVCSIALFLSGIFLCCCLVPFCVDNCKDVHHVCPNCSATVGVYRRT